MCVLWDMTSNYHPIIVTGPVSRLMHRGCSRCVYSPSHSVLGFVFFLIKSITHNSVTMSQAHHKLN